jgi:hypothetical protein
MWKVWGRVAAYAVFYVETDGKSPLGKTRRRWENNINMDLQKVECEFMAWIDVDQVRDRRQALVDVTINFPVS